MSSRVEKTVAQPRRILKGRIESLDGLRSIAALGVMIFHYNLHFETGLEALVPGLHRAYLLVDLFFVLSGFVIAENYAGRITTVGEYGSYLVRRIARVYPLHLFMLVTVLALGQTLLLVGYWPNLPPHMDFDGLWANISLTHGWGVKPIIYFNYPSWSISAEMMQYALFPLYLIVATRLSPLATLALFVGCVAAISHGYMGWDHWHGFTADGALRAVPSFFAGTALSVGLRRRAVVPRVPWVAVYAYALGLLACIGLGLYDAWIVVLAPGLIVLAALAERGNARTWLSRRPMAVLGQASYAIYMLHIPVSMVVLGIGRPLFGDAPAVSIGLFLTAALATVWLSVLCFHRFERPAQRLVNRSYDGLRRSVARPIASA